ncbi:hypothetical protein BOW53_08690 [Solemya pervernicosa gill symbiont]|uniref:Uncharacterized protein n=2 Tax=Gammaproteobacteria incertae sedis TaxID=118884 RepID=A0A1T2L527_9GAMM|nr:tetratricopeptide repeat protein [Candidatus Reidiella endopervernicosa]OOZ40171.1 hypothetical protein BOW53_08690 [Solemya pervernicosa gill symbiont]QKQ25105.1 glycosyltransferase family protein [Candidatus Reidiella endopervernicosa]
MSKTRVNVTDLFNEAKALFDKEAYQEAVQKFITVSFAQPSNWHAYALLGACFENMGYRDAAIVSMQRASIILPKHPQIWLNLARLLSSSGRAEEAVEAFEKVVELQPGHLEAHHQAGMMLRGMNRNEESLGHFDHVVAGTAKSDKEKEYQVVAEWVRSLDRLTMGDYQAAWKDYETRWRLPGTFVHRLDGPEWKGESLEGKRIVLTYEQRFGDVINFVRFIPRLKALGAEVIVQSPPELAHQLAHMTTEVEIVDKDVEPPPFDYYVLVTSVPAILNLSLDDVMQDEVPYLQVDERDRKPELPMRRGTWLKVGLLWTGKPDPNRSIPFEHMTPLLRHPGVSFYSFQLGKNSADPHKQGMSWLVNDLSPEISDFYDSSLLLKEMDLFITIDTAAAHQAGALGVPVWTLLIYAPDWRWMRDREDSPWYPSMRFFRQTRKNSWKEAARNLDVAFEQWVESNPPPVVVNSGG